MTEQQKKGTSKGNATEKSVHDLTKQEDLSRVLEQSLRALQEMEQRLQMLEQELGTIGARPQTSPPRVQPTAPGASQQYIGAPNPHGLQGAWADPFSTHIHPAVSSPWMSGAGLVGSYPPEMAPSPSMFASPFSSALQPSQSIGTMNPMNPMGPVNPAMGMGFQALGAQARPISTADFSDAVQGVNAVAGSGGEVSRAMQIGGQGDLNLHGGGTRTQDFSEMTPQIKQAVMDVVDRSDEFLIHWELPGVKKENLDIMVTDKSVILNAKVFPELEDGLVVHSERPPAVYRRTIPFQTEVDTSKAKANLKDGVLTLHVPKRTPSNGPKRLDVAYG